MSTTSVTIGKPLQDLVQQGSTTEAEKIDCLKLLKVVIKNLCDPVKSQEAKYRQLKLENEKVQAKILPFPSAVEFLKSVGFSEATDDSSARILRIDSVNASTMQASMQEVIQAMELVTRQKSAQVHPNTLSLAQRMSAPAAKLSEKQKARVLLEEKAKRERQESRRQRAKNLALLKQDKHVRKHDENWKSGVSAAMAKTGNSISTFRDRHGEN